MNDTHLLEALERVMIWNLPEELFPAALNDQYRLMCGGDPEGPREEPG